MDQGGLTELHVVDGDQEVRLSRRDESPAAPVVVGAAPAPMAAPVAAPAAPAEAPAPAPVEEGTLFRSPMVGTFYARPNPDADAYVSVGDSFGDGTVLCILEAMKVFNEIPAGVSGQVVAVLVENGAPVEFGQPLIKVDPGA